MRQASAAIGSVLFFLMAPVVVAGVIPWSITRWEVAQPLRYGWMQQLAAGILILLGACVLLHAFTRFVLEGLGTPAPVAPTAHLVVGGLYRYVRNPMYLAVLSIIIGQALALGQTSLAIYGTVICAAFVIFVRVYEEPTLARRFGKEYEAYRRAVPGWWPRFRTSHPARRTL